MAAEPLRVLLIQSWVIRSSAVREALRLGGYEPQVYRVDFEPALAAALPRSGYDVVILDAKTSGVSRVTVEASMREHGVKVPLVELMVGRSLGADVRAALTALRN